MYMSVPLFLSLCVSLLCYGIWQSLKSGVQFSRPIIMFRVTTKRPVFTSEESTYLATLNTFPSTVNTTTGDEHISTSSIADNCTSTEISTVHQGIKISTETNAINKTGTMVNTTTGDEHISTSSIADNCTSTEISTVHQGIKISTETNAINNTGTMEIDYVQKGKEILEMATKILNTGEWVFERRTEDGDSLFSRQLDNGDIVYRLTAVIDLPAHDLMVILYHDLESYPKWNPTLLECRVIQKFDETTDVSYQVTAPGARGCVASRDFITVRHWKMKDNTYIAASASIDYPGIPVNTDYIRGHSGPGCWELRPLSNSPEKTEYRWLLNTKLNGWIPLYIADKAFKKFMAKYMSFLRAYCEKVKDRAMSNAANVTASQNITS